jgi:hypothetical protein
VKENRPVSLLKVIRVMDHRNQNKKKAVSIV